jgi:hypothetical protein
MKRLVLLSIALVVFGSESAVFAQPSTPLLRGVWKVVEVTGGAEGSNTHPQPGLFIFTDKHYSFMRVTGTKARPKFQSNATATDSEKVASYDGFFAQAGTYQVSGSTITTQPVVAKAEFPMIGPPSKAEIKIDGNTLWWTFATGQVAKLIRVE